MFQVRGASHLNVLLESRDEVIGWVLAGSNRVARPVDWRHKLLPQACTCVADEMPSSGACRYCCRLAIHQYSDPYRVRAFTYCCGQFTQRCASMHGVASPC